MTTTEHRAYDESDVARAMRMTENRDVLAILETIVADKLTDGMANGTDGIIEQTTHGYDTDDCGNRRMRIDAFDNRMRLVAHIDVTDIVSTILDLEENMMRARLTDLEDSYDLHHHRGIYADEAEA